MEKNKISLSAAILMNMNLMVGAGIYLNPMLMAQKAGSSSFLGWLLVAAIFFPVVWSIAKVTDLFPGEGSFYSYSKSTLGKSAGFASGWVYFLGYVSIAALQTVGLREVLIHQFGFQAAAEHPFLFNSIFLGLIYLLNLFNLRLVSRIQSGITLFKLLPLLTVLILFAFYWNPNLSLFDPASLSNLHKTIPIALFGFWGFEGCASISHLIAGDKRNTYRAILGGFGLTVLLYLVFHFGILNIMGADALAKEGVAGFVNYLHLKIPLLASLLTGLIYTSIVMAFIGAIYSGFVANASLLNAMANEDLLFCSFHIKRTNKHERPWIALLIHSFLLFIFSSLVGNKDILNAMSNWGVLSAFIFTFLSLLVIQKTQKDVWGICLTLLAFVNTLLLSFMSWELVGTTSSERCMNSVPLLIITMAGIAMYVVKNKRKEWYSLRPNKS